MPCQKTHQLKKRKTNASAIMPSFVLMVGVQVCLYFSSSANGSLYAFQGKHILCCQNFSIIRILNCVPRGKVETHSNSSRKLSQVFLMIMLSLNWKQLDHAVTKGIFWVEDRTSLKYGTKNVKFSKIANTNQKKATFYHFLEETIGLLG